MRERARGAKGKRVRQGGDCGDDTVVPDYAPEDEGLEAAKLISRILHFRRLAFFQEGV